MSNPNHPNEVLDELSTEDRHQYDQILQSLLRKYSPAGALVESLACDVWTSRRMVRLRAKCPPEPENPAAIAIRHLAARRLALAARNYSRTLRHLNQLRKSSSLARPQESALVRAGFQRPAASTPAVEWIN